MEREEDLRQGLKELRVVDQMMWERNLVPQMLEPGIIGSISEMNFPGDF